MSEQKNESMPDEAKLAVDRQQKKNTILKIYPLLYGLETFVATMLGFRIVLAILKATPDHWLVKIVNSLTDPLVQPFIGLSQGTIFGFEIEASAFIAIVFYSIVLHIAGWVLHRLYTYRLAKMHS